MLSADGLEQCTSFGDSPIEKSFAPFLGTDSSPQKLEITIRHPTAALEIVRCEIFQGRAGRDHLSLVVSDFKPNLEKEASESIEEQLDCMGLAGDCLIVQKEGLVVQFPRVLSLRDSYWLRARLLAKHN